MHLDEHLIRTHLQTIGFNELVDFHIFPSIDSTNRYLKELPNSQYPITLCCAEAQSQGRGRLQRVWYSPEAENIYCSIRWNFPKNTTALSTLSLVVSLAVLHSLQNLNIAPGIAIKWPNDLIWQDKKLCGILIETTQYDPQHLNVVVGIGLNVNSDPNTHISDQAPNKPWCSLYQITHQHLDRNELIAHILMKTHQYLNIFKNEGFIPFLELWRNTDYLYGKQVQIDQTQQMIQGIAQGITVRGELIVLDNQQKQCNIACGEASVIYS